MTWIWTWRQKRSMAFHKDEDHELSNCVGPLTAALFSTGTAFRRKANYVDNAHSRDFPEFIAFRSPSCLCKTLNLRNPVSLDNPFTLFGRLQACLPGSVVSHGSANQRCFARLRGFPVQRGSVVLRGSAGPGGRSGLSGPADTCSAEQRGAVDFRGPAVLRGPALPCCPADVRWLSGLRSLSNLRSSVLRKTMFSPVMFRYRLFLGWVIL
jgi:hypothetical protein